MSRSLEVWCDGSGTVVQGPACISVAIVHEGGVVLEGSEYVGNGTNNGEAHAQALGERRPEATRSRRRSSATWHQGVLCAATPAHADSLPRLPAGDCPQRCGIEGRMKRGGHYPRVECVCGRVVGSNRLKVHARARRCAEQAPLPIETKSNRRRERQQGAGS